MLITKVYLKNVKNYLMLTGLSINLVGNLTGTAHAELRILSDSTAIKQTAIKQRNNFPVLFLTNQGQWAPEVIFKAQTNTANFWFTNREILIQAIGNAQQNDIVHMFPVSAASEMQLTPGSLVHTQVSDFHGQDPAKWKTHIPAYNSISYQNAAPGANLIFRDSPNGIAYDLIFKPGVDPSSIQLAINGVTKLTLNDKGDLQMILPHGEILQQQAPQLYQEREGRRIQIAGGFVIADTSKKNEHTIGFWAGEHDKSLPLIIDPTLTYSTFVGSSLTDDARAVAVTETGEVIVVGSTQSSSFPGTPTVFGTQLKKDALIYRISADGTALDYVVILGGSLDDQINAITLDSDGAIYLAGQTNSTDFPLKNPFYPVLPGTAQAAFLVKLNVGEDKKTITLIFSTYFGGTKIDSGRAIGLDSTGAVYMAGTTGSTDLITRHALYPTSRGGDDGFLIKMTITDTSGTLQSSTYFGGSGNDSVDILAVTDEGDVYLGGTTVSRDLPVKYAIQAQNAGSSDIFVARIATEGPELAFCTYLGGSTNETLTSMIKDQDNHLILTGYTNSTNFPVKNALYNHLSGKNDAFVAKLDNSGRFLHFATYLGGNEDDLALSSALEQDNDVDDGLRYLYIGGSTQSTQFPLVNADQIWYAGSQDAFLAKLDPHGLRLTYSSYFGGKSSDSITALGILPKTGTRAVFLAGNTSSTQAGLFPVGQNTPYQVDNAGGIDTFLAYRQDISNNPDTPLLELGFQTVTPESDGADVGLPLTLTDPNSVGISALSTQIFYDINELEYTETIWNTELPSTAVTNVDLSLPGRLLLTLYQNDTPTAVSGSLANLKFLVRNVGSLTTPPRPSKQIILTQQEAWAADLNGRNAFLTAGAGGLLLARRCNNLLGDCDCSGQVRIWEVQAAVLKNLGDAATQPACVKRDYTAMTPTDLTEIINNYLDQVTETTSAIDLIAQNQVETQAATSQLTLGQVTKTNGVINAKFRLQTAGKSISLVSTDVLYDPKILNDPTVTNGPAATAAAKNVVFKIIKPGRLRVITWGLNKTTLANGTLAILHVKPKVNLSRHPTSISHQPLASNPNAQKITLQGNRLPLNN